MTAAPIHGPPLPSALHGQVPIEELELQKSWELEGVRRAVRRFREEQRDLTSDRRVSGSRIIHDVAPRLVTLLRTAQKEAIESIANAGKGGQVRWRFHIALLPPDVLGVTVILQAMAALCGPRRHLRWPSGTLQASMLAEGVAKAVKLQAEFGGWVKAERASAKESHKAGGAYLNLYEALRRNARRIDTRAVKTWWRRIARMRDAPWPKEDCVVFGSALLALMVEAGGGWFESVLVPLTGGRTMRAIRLSADALAAMDSLQEEAEHILMMRLPMICPPLPWRFE